MHPDSFELYDLKVIIEEIRGNCTCDNEIGQYFELRGGKIHLPPNQSFCLYALQAVIPLLPAKQRILHPADWMETDTRITCPDPHCGLIMLIERTGKQVFRHDDVSAVPLKQKDS
jgi:uncharacterized repeat protein (TIGR04076 family)